MTEEWTQTELFAEAGGPEPHARMTDPVSSDLTVKSLGRDTSYNWRIFTAIMHLSERSEWRDNQEGIAVIWDQPVTDDAIWSWMERHYGGRFQRNIIARQRGLIREAGWIRRADDVEVNGTPRVAHIPTSAGVDAWHRNMKEGYST